MIDRYSRPEMRALWSEEAKYRRWLEVEITVCEVLAEAGLVPPRAVEKIKAKAAFDVARIDAIEREVRHDVIAFLTNVAESVGPEARWLHYGMTSSDVLDTALALQLRDAGRLLQSGVERVMLALQRRALEEVSVGKISGAVGTFGHFEPRVEEEVCRRLGIGFEPVATQVVQRDRHAAFVATLAVLASSLDKFAIELRHLARSEVSEVEEEFGAGQKGSSAMPHKRNPWRLENVSGLARVVRGHAVSALENVALWHERDISNSSVERVVLPDATLALDFMLQRFAHLVETLVVHAERMRANISDDTLAEARRLGIDAARPEDYLGSTGALVDRALIDRDT